MSRPITLEEEVSISLKPTRAGCGACEILNVVKRGLEFVWLSKPVVQFLLGLSRDIFHTAHCTFLYTCVLTLHTDRLGNPTGVISLPLLSTLGCQQCCEPESSYRNVGPTRRLPAGGVAKTVINTWLNAMTPLLPRTVVWQKDLPTVSCVTSSLLRGSDPRTLH